MFYDAATDVLTVEPEAALLPVVPMQMKGIEFVPRILPPVHVPIPGVWGHGGGPPDNPPHGGGDLPPGNTPLPPHLPPAHGGGSIRGTLDW